MPYNQRPNRHIFAAQQPECPGRKPAVAFLSCQWKHLILKQSPQDWTIVSFINPCYSYGELHVLELLQTNLHGVVEVVS